MNIEEFKSRFKKGDILVIDESWVFNLMGTTVFGDFHPLLYNAIISINREYIGGVTCTPKTGIGSVEDHRFRLANNIEKQTFYSRLKDNGYVWDEGKVKLSGI